MLWEEGMVVKVERRSLRWEQDAFVAAMQKIGLKDGTLMLCPWPGCKQVKAVGQSVLQHLVLTHSISRPAAERLVARG